MCCRLLLYIFVFNIYVTVVRELFADGSLCESRHYFATSGCICQQQFEWSFYSSCYKRWIFHIPNTRRWTLWQERNIRVRCFDWICVKSHWLKEHTMFFHILSHLFYVTTCYFVTLFLNLFCKWELWLFGNLRYRPNEVLCNRQNFKFSFRLLRESLWFSSSSYFNKPYLSLCSLRWQCYIC